LPQKGQKSGQRAVKSFPLPLENSQNLPTIKPWYGILSKPFKWVFKSEARQGKKKASMKDKKRERGRIGTFAL